MKDIQQLIKKNSQEGRYEDIFPKTFTNAVKDKESGKSLIDILSSFNMYFLSYNGSRELTRLQVPMSIRKTGLWVTYVLYDKTVVTEWYAGEAIDDDSWKSPDNWRVGTNMLVGDISISSDGYWVVNGVVTTTKAQGEQGITPMLRVRNNHLQVSYTKGSSWIDVSEFTNSLHIKGYVATVAALPSSAVQGDIYGVGPTYDPSDTGHTNPIYQLYVKDSTGWVNNGKFTSIAAGVVQNTGTSTTEVMSQDAVSKEFVSVRSDLSEIASQQILDIPDNLLITSIDNFNAGTIETDGTITADGINIYSYPIFLGKGDIMVYKGGIYNKPILSKTNADGTAYSPIVIGYDTQTIERTYVAQADIYVSVCTNKYYFNGISINRASRTLEQIKTQINDGIFTPDENFVFSTENLKNYANYNIYIKHSFVINSNFTFPDNVTLIFENGGKLVSGKEDKNLGVIANRLYIRGNNLTIIADSNANDIVDGLIFSNGTLSNKEVYLSWFGNIEDIVFNDSFEFTADDREKGTINQMVLANASYATQDTIIYINRNLGICKLIDNYNTICNGHIFRNVGECKIFGVSETQSTLGISRFKGFDGLIFANVKIVILNTDGYYGEGNSVNVTPIPFTIKNCKFLGSKHNSVCSINISEYAGTTITDYKTSCKKLQGSIICDNYFINGGGGDWRYGQSIDGNFASGTGGDAIFINTADGWVIERNIILGNYCNGIRSYSAENCIIKDNIINGNRIEGYGYQRGLVDGVTEGLIRCKEFDMIAAIKNYYPAQYQRPYARFKNNIISNNIVSNIMDEGICFESYTNLCIYVGTCTATEIEEKEYRGNKTKYRITFNNTLPSYYNGLSCQRTITDINRVIGCDIEIINGNAKGTIAELLKDDDGIYVECSAFSNITSNTLVVVSSSCKNNTIEGNLLENIRRPALYLDGSCNYNRIINNEVRFCKGAIRLYDYVADDGRLIALNNYNEIRGNKVYDTPDVNFEPTYINDKSIFSFSNVPITYYGTTQVVPDPNVRSLRAYSEGTQGILIGSKSKDQWVFNNFNYVKSETVKAQCKSFGNVVKDNICEYIYLYNGITTIVESNVGNVILASSVDYVATNTHQVIKALDNFVYLEKVIDSVNDSLYKMDYTFNQNEDLSLINELTEQTV